MSSLKIIYCGTPEFSVPTLSMLCDHPQVELLSVITMPDRPSGRGKKLTSPPVAQFAKERQLPLIQVENINHSPEILKLAQKADIILVLAFAQFLNSKILDAPKIGPFNIHTSLLPKPLMSISSYIFSTPRKQKPLAQFWVAFPEATSGAASKSAL